MRQIVIMALLLLQTVAVLAQEKIETIFKIVLNDPSTEVLSNTNFNVGCPDGSVSYCKYTEFKLPTKKKKLFGEIEKVMLNATLKAYDVYIKKPGSNAQLVKNNKYVYGVKTSTAYSLVSISRTIIMDCASMMPTTRFADMHTCIYGLRTAATIIAITIIYMVSVRPDLMSTRRKSPRLISQQPRRL